MPFLCSKTVPGRFPPCWLITSGITVGIRKCRGDMKSIRRLYFYLVAFISIEVVVWGLIGLLRSIVDETVSGGAEALAQALALILVGVPIFLIHWLWAQ